MVSLEESLIVKYRIQGLDEPISFHSHQEYEIYFFHEGSCRYLIHNQVYDLKPGDIILMDGMTLHKPNVSPNTNYVRSIVQFSPYLVKDILGELDVLYLLSIFKNLNQCLIRTNENEESKQLESIIGNLQLAHGRPSETLKLHDEVEKKYYSYSC